jgi:hypothetical protein
MKKVYFLEKDSENPESKVLLPYKKEIHSEKIGKFIGFSLPDEKKVFIGSYSFVHHNELQDVINKTVPETVGAEMFCAGNATAGNILLDIVFFSHDDNPAVCFPGLTKGFFTPLKAWDETINTFGLGVIPTNK